VGEIEGDDEIGLVGFEFARDDPVEGVSDEDAHGTGAAERVGQAGKCLPGVGAERVELDLGVEGAVMKVDEIRDADELVVASFMVEAEAADAGGKERRVGVTAAGDREVRKNTVLAEGGVPKGDVVGDVGYTEKAVAGTEEGYAVAVAHERVVKGYGRV